MHSIKGVHTKNWTVRKTSLNLSACYIFKNLWWKSSNGSSDRKIAANNNHFYNEKMYFWNNLRTKMKKAIGTHWVKIWHMLFKRIIFRKFGWREWETFTPLNFQILGYFRIFVFKCHFVTILIKYVQIRAKLMQTWITKVFKKWHLWRRKIQNDMQFERLHIQVLLKFPETLLAWNIWAIFKPNVFQLFFNWSFLCASYFKSFP